MAARNPQPLPPGLCFIEYRQDSSSSSLSDDGSYFSPVRSLESSPSLTEARPSSIPSDSDPDPPAGQSKSRPGARHTFSSFRSLNPSDKRQSLTSARLDKKSFGDKLKFALDLSFSGGDPNRQVKSYQEPVVVRTAKARAIEISRPSRPGSSSSKSIKPGVNSKYINKPFASRQTKVSEPPAELEADFPVAELDSKELPAKETSEQLVQSFLDLDLEVDAPVTPRPRPTSWRLARLNNRLEQHLELPPLLEEDGEFDDDEMKFIRNLASRLQRKHTPDNNAPAKPRPLISLPLELIHASNTSIVLEAPDISSHPALRNNSFEDTETSMVSDPGLTDSSSVSSESSPNPSSDGSPTSATFAAEQTSFYNPAQSPLVHPIPVSPIKPDLDGTITIVAADGLTLPPAIPQRAQSHSKREHVRLARARSMRSRSVSRAPSEVQLSVHPSLTHLAETPELEPVSPLDESEHPFCTELAQLDQMAQELARAAAREHARRSLLEDRAAMSNAGLGQYSASDYQFDLDSLIGELGVAEENPWERTLPKPLAL